MWSIGPHSTEDTHLGFLRREGAADFTPPARSTKPKHCQRVVPIQIASKQRQAPLSSAPVAAARLGFHVRKSQGNVEIDPPRCVGASTHEHSGRLNRFPASRASLGPKTDIWIEDILAEESDAIPDPTGGRLKKSGPSRHTKTDHGRRLPRDLSREVPKRAGDERTVPDESSRVWQSPARAKFSGPPSRPPQRGENVADSSGLQFTPPRSAVFSPARTPPSAFRHRPKGALPTTHVVAQTTVHRFELGCWKALCRAVIPADCCGVSPPPQTKFKSRRRSRFRRSVGELVVSRNVIVESPWSDAEDQYGYYDSGEDMSSEDEEEIASSWVLGRLVDQINLPPTIAGERSPGLGAHHASSEAALPSSGTHANEGEAALPLLSNRDDTLSSCLTLQRSLLLNDCEPRRRASKFEETGELTPCWVEAERVRCAL